MSESAIIVHGHRGSRGTHPENTIPSFAEAHAAGAAFVELDVHLSKDGHVIVFHDYEITGKLCRDHRGEPVEGNTPLRSLTLQEIKSFECGSNLLPAFPEQNLQPGIRIPTLDEVIQWKLRHAPSLHLNIEIKNDSRPGQPDARELASSVIALLKQNHLAHSSLIQSFDLDVVREARKLDSSVQLSCLFEMPADYVSEALNCKARFLAPHHRLIDETLAELCQEAGLELLPWTVNREEDWDRMLELGVRSIITDYPRRLKAYAEQVIAE